MAVTENIEVTLELRENNLYRNGEVLVFDDGETLLLREHLDIEQTTGDRHHVMKKYDELTLLAGKYYMDQVPDPSKWWYVIADANGIINPMDLSEWAGKEIVIPDIFKVQLLL